MEEIDTIKKQRIESLSKIKRVSKKYLEANKNKKS